MGDLEGKSATKKYKNETK